LSHALSAFAKATADAPLKTGTLLTHRNGHVNARLRCKAQTGVILWNRSHRSYRAYPLSDPCYLVSIEISSMRSSSSGLYSRTMPIPGASYLSS